VLGAPRQRVCRVLEALREVGWKMVVHTTRGEQEISDYLMRHGIVYDEIKQKSDCRTHGAKPVADVYWDDRAVVYSGDAIRDLERIRQFRTWSGRE
jgi:hypothetical protein